MRDRSFNDAVPFSISPSLDCSPLEMEFFNMSTDWDFYGVNWTDSRASGTGPSINDTSPVCVGSVSSKFTGPGSLADFSRNLTSNIETNSDPEYNSVPMGIVNPSEAWYPGFIQCTKLRFLVQMFRAIDRSVHSPINCGSLASIPLQPEQKSIEPLLKTFVSLERTLKQQQVCQLLHQSGGEAAITTPGDSRVRHLLPARSVCDRLLDAYLNSFESVLRILHVPTFIKEYDRLWSEDTNDEVFEHKLLVSLAVGSCACSDLNSSLREQVPGWIAHCSSWLAERATLGVQPDFDSAQVTCLLALARQTLFNSDTTSDLSVVDAMSLPGAHDLIRLAIQLDLHREPRVRSPGMPVKEGEMQRRLWATMLELALQLCLDQRLAPPIGPENYDCESPSGVSDEDICLDMPPSGCVVEFTASTPIMMLARTQRLRIRVLQHLVKFEINYEESHQYSLQLNAACRANAKMLRSVLLSSVPTSSKPTNIQLMLLSNLFRPFVLALHSPFAEQATAGKTDSYYSRRACLEISALLLSDTPVLPLSVDDHRTMEMMKPTTTAGEKTNPGELYAAIRVHAHGHFAHVQLQAAAALSMNLFRDLEDNPFPTLDSASRQQLHKTLRSVVDIFERRVRASGGIDSGRDFVFVSCAEAYIASLSAQLQSSFSHDNSDWVIARAARTSLAVCCEVMTERQSTSVFGKG